jgi:hypothetical protein
VSDYLEKLQKEYAEASGIVNPFKDVPAMIRRDRADTLVLKALNAALEYMRSQPSSEPNEAIDLCGKALEAMGQISIEEPSK